MEEDNLLNETNIKCFLVLTETLSFTETAARVHLTQQAVSKNIYNLESTLGFPLVSRSNRSISLTEEGRKCSILFRELEKIYTLGISELRSGYIKSHASINVGYQNFQELGVELINANNALQEEFPDAQILGVRHSPGELKNLFLKNQLDLIIICSRYMPSNQDFCSYELLRIPNVIMVSPENPNATADATYLDFKDEPYLVNIFENETMDEFDRRVRSEIDTCGLTPSNIVILPNRESAYSAAELGNGIILGSEISQTTGSRLLRYTTASTESISCYWKKDEPKIVVQKYADCLKNAYSR